MSECNSNEIVKQVMHDMRQDICDMVVKYKDNIPPSQFIAILLDNAVDLAVECAPDKHNAYSALLSIISILITSKDEEEGQKRIADSKKFKEKMAKENKHE